VHQDYKMLKPEAHSRFQPAATEPNSVRIDTLVEVTDIFPLKNRRQMEALDSEHIWSPALIDMRFSYKPQNPLYLLIVRAYVLREPVTIDNSPTYAGCKSWVPLVAALQCGDAQAVVDDAAFEARRKRIARLINSSPC
jgi:hypothetical protein